MKEAVMKVMEGYVTAYKNNDKSCKSWCNNF